MSANAIAARSLLSLSGKRRGNLQWHFANLALMTWISRHLSGEEALSTALATMPFGPGSRGLREAAQTFLGKQVEQLDAEEVARLMVLSRSPGWYRQPDKWRAARDRLLQEMRRNGTIDDATLLEATARSLEWRPPTPVELDEEWRQTSATRFTIARGDFDGDGKPDEARLLLSHDGKRLAIVATLSSSGERLVSQWEGGLTRMGIATLPPGRYRTACGKGYFECEPQEPEELVTRWDGIDLFYEESADGVYYMPERDREFVHIRLSD